MFLYLNKPLRLLPLLNSSTTRKFSIFHHSPHTLAPKKILILGSGWSGFNVALSLSKKQTDVTLVSPVNHFLFTPLLPSSATGTLEFRAIQECVRTVPGIIYYQAKASSIDFTTNTVNCDGINSLDSHDKFTLQYDQLVIACGVKTQTFKIPGVNNLQKEEKELFFLKTLHDARNIRLRTIECFEIAALPCTSVKEKERLLSFVIVGGGATSCEYVSELHDFIAEDIHNLYPELYPYVKITLVEASGSLLPPFDEKLRDYCLGLFSKRAIDVRLETAVTAVEGYEEEGFRHEGKRARVVSSGGKESLLPFGMMVWCAGLQPITLSTTLPPSIKRSSAQKRISTDAYLRVLGQEDKVWAVGDCAAIQNEQPLPQLAQVAQQQAAYLSKILNGERSATMAPFNFYSLGSMASLGLGKGVYDGGGKWVNFHGFLAWITWRTAYWGKSVSWNNKVLIPMYWFKTFWWGRDVSRF